MFLNRDIVGRKLDIDLQMTAKNNQDIPLKQTVDTLLNGKFKCHFQVNEEEINLYTHQDLNSSPIIHVNINSPDGSFFFFSLLLFMLL